MDLALSLLLATLIGLTLGAVGGGGSILAVPVLVGVVGLSVTDATTASLIVVGTAAVIGLLSELPVGRGTDRGNGRVQVGPGLVFGLTGIGGAFVGTRLNQGLDEGVLLIGFSALMAVVAATMAHRILAGRTAEPSAPAPTVPTSTVPARDERGAASLAGVPAQPGPRPTAGDTSGTNAGGSRAERVRNCRVVAGINTCQIVRLVAAGSTVGLLTGLFGVGGGFVIVPALVLVLGFEIGDATATSLLVIAVNSSVALAMRADLGSIDWGVVLPFTSFATVGVLVGRRLAHRVSARTLSAVLTVLIALMALWTAAQGIGAL